MSICWDITSSTNSKYDGKNYFINRESGISQWGLSKFLPAGWQEHYSESQNLVFYSNPRKNKIQVKKPIAEDGDQVPKGWIEKRSRECNNLYYQNILTGKTQWEYPDDYTTINTTIESKSSLTISKQMQSIPEQDKLEQERQRKLEQDKLEQERQRKLEQEWQRILEQERQRILEQERQRKSEQERQRILQEEAHTRKVDEEKKIAKLKEIFTTKVDEKRPVEQIKVLTYNVAHEIGKSPICNGDECIKNVREFINQHASDCDFIGIQEYSDIGKLIKDSGKLFRMKNTHFIYKKYGPITFYDGEKYMLDKDCNSMKFGFNGPMGRPILINFFNNNLCVINVHAGHLTKPVVQADGKILVANDITTFNDSLELYLKDNKFITVCKDEFIQKLQTYRIIMLGDMNSDLHNFKSITVNGLVIKLYGGTKDPTCCSDVTKLDGVYADVKKPYDHILNNFSNKIDTKVYQDLKSHSDHSPVISTITI